MVEVLFGKKKIEVVCDVYTSIPNYEKCAVEVVMPILS